MINLFSKLNEYFIADEDEKIKATDYFFYAWIGGLVAYLVITIILNITF